ncbi:hypothetical protein HYT01_00290 [Candidatus Giovannonibacteria bacterium]|nr:hypothetical protein [Candidatus Giovannonibacteria bacterium]
MLIVSHHVLDTTPLKLPKGAVLRINVAWVKDLVSLTGLLKRIKHDVYLDYPQGRSKPPRPSITLKETLSLVKKFPNIKYFAVSNVEDPLKIYEIRKQLPASIGLVPKIETKNGVNNLEAIIKKINAKHIMLDKEDLYTDLKMDHNLFLEYIDKARHKAKTCGTDVLELHGVVFYPYRDFSGESKLV